MTVVKQDHTQMIDLDSLDFSFAVEKIDQSLGRIVAEKVSWSGVDGIKRYEPVVLVPCNSFKAQDLSLGNPYSEVRDVSTNTG